MTVDNNSPRQLHVAVFSCLKLADNIATTRGQFGELFGSWLTLSAKKYKSERPPAEKVQIKISSWDVVRGEYPPAVDDIDVIIVSGATASAYDPDQWIADLAKYIQDVYQNSNNTRIYGGCFGHQLVSQALLRDYGTRVEKSPKGWEIGVHQIDLSSEFKSHFPRLRERDSMSCQFLHADHVVHDEASRLPKGWVALGSSSLCDVQGIYYPGKVLTFQGHPEFDVFLNEQAVVNLGLSKTLNEKEVGEALELIRQDDDRILHGEIFIDFVLHG